MRPYIPVCALLLCACPPALPTTVVVENGGTEAIWLATDDGHLPGRWFGDVGGERLSLVPSTAHLCLPECGKPGAIACAELAAPIPVAWALLPGESLSTELGGELWYRREDPLGACAARFTGVPTLEVCTSLDAVDSAGNPLASPTVGGAADFGSDVVNPTCSSHDVTLEEENVLVVGG